MPLAAGSSSGSKGPVRNGIPTSETKQSSSMANTRSDSTNPQQTVFASLPLDDVCHILSPDELLPSFYNPAIIAAHILHKFSDTAEERNAAILQECDDASDGTSGVDDPVGLAVEQVADACHMYVKRFQKRMELLQRYSAETTERSNLGARVLSQRIQDYYKRPFATFPGKCIFCFHVLLVVVPLVSMTLQTVPALNPRLEPSMRDVWIPLETIISLIFLGDVVAIFIATMLDPERSVSDNVLDYVTSLSNVLDLTAMILPTVQVFQGDNPLTNAFILFRLLRMYRLMSGLRHFYAFEDLFETLFQAAVPLVGPIVAVILFLIGFASLVYTMEAGSYNPVRMQFLVRDEDCELKPRFVLGLENCPRVESKFLSIFHSMWFALIALLTIGYGDLVPRTFNGRMVALLCIVLGQLLMAMPIAIIGNKFTKVVAHLKDERRAVSQYIEESEKDKRMHAAVRACINNTASTLEPAEARISSDASGTTPLLGVVDADQTETLTSRCAPDGTLGNVGIMGSTLDTTKAPVHRSNTAASLPTRGDASEDITRATMPSVMFFRFLQFALKQRTLSFTDSGGGERTSNRLVHYVVERYLRHAASKLIAHHERKYRADELLSPTVAAFFSSAGSSPSDAIEMSERAPLPTAVLREGRAGAGQSVRPVLVLLHPDVLFTVPLADRDVFEIGADPACEVVIRSPLVSALTHTLFSEVSRQRRKVAASRRKGTSSAGRSSEASLAGDDRTSASTFSSSQGVTNTQLALQRSYVFNPLHAKLLVHRNRSGDPRSDVVYVSSVGGSPLFLNGSAVDARDMVSVAVGSTIQYSQIAHAPVTKVTFGYPYQKM